MEARVIDPETTSKGAALMAGIATGLFSLEQIVDKGKQGGHPVEPQISTEQREKLVKGWKRALATLDDEDSQ